VLPILAHSLHSCVFTQKIVKLAGEKRG